MSEENQNTLVLDHVGAADDRYEWSVPESGLMMFVGPKAQGKTTAQRALGVLSQAPDDMRLRIPITRGADRAEIQFRARRVTLELGPGGELREPVVAGTEPEIEEVPGAITTLITGDGLVSPRARHEHRLKALLAYSPVEATEERLDALLGCLVIPQAGGVPAKPRAFAGADADAVLAGKWEELAKARAKKSFRFEKLRGPSELRAWILAQPARKGSVLGDHARLIDILNATANAGKKAHDEQDNRLAAIIGKLEQARASAAQQLGLATPPASFGSQLQAEYDLEALIGTRDALHSVAEKLRSERAARVAGEQRQARLTERLGERPEIDGMRRQVHEKAIADGEKVAAAARADLEQRRLALGKAESGAAAAANKVRAAWNSVEEYWKDLAATLFDPEEADVRWGAEVSVSRGTRLITVLAKAVEQDPAAQTAACRVSIEEGERGLSRRQEALTQVRKDLEGELERYREAKSAQKRWDAMKAEIDETIPGPEQANVDDAESRAAEAQADVSLANAAAGYQVIAAEHRAAVELLAKLDEITKDYLAAKTDSWDYLGGVVTEAVDLPYLMVKGTEIYLGFVDGKLNTDPAVIAEARKRAEEALRANEDSRTPIPRLMVERILAESGGGAEWRAADSNEMSTEAGWDLSEAELTEAMMQVWLERQDRGAVRTCPPSITNAYDHATLQAFAAECRERGLLVFGARPRRDGDPEGLHLEEVVPIDPSEEAP